MNTLIVMNTLNSVQLYLRLVRNGSVRYLRRKSHDCITVSNILDALPEINKPSREKTNKQKNYKSKKSEVLRITLPSN